MKRTPSTRGFAKRSDTMLTRAILTAFAASMIVAGCGDDSGPQSENRLPTAQLTAAPVEGDTTNYQVRLFWTGSDLDGYVAAYEIAVDPPEAIEADVDAAGVAWERTTDFSRLFRFSATHPESASFGTAPTPTGRFHGMHAVYVRSVDDDGAKSIPDHVAFTAQTIAPTSRFDRPSPPAGSIGVITSPTFRLRWSGHDPDHEPDAAAPLRFEYAVVQQPSIICLTIDCRAAYIAALRSGTWLPLPADSIEIHITPGFRYMVLGVRAVDEAGAVEPFLDFGRNAMLVHALPNAGLPLLTLSSELGTFTFHGLSTPVEIETVVNIPTRVAVSASAQDYGEDITDWRWGIDLADLDAEVGWSAWTTDPNLPPLSFPGGDIHTLYVEARDTAGGLTRATLIMNVIETPMDRPLLWVDDFRDTIYPSDIQHDAFWNGLFRDSGRFEMTSNVFKYETHGVSDTYSMNPIPPMLAQLCRYRLIVWECAGDGFEGRSGLLITASRNPTLGLYLRAGGQLWVDGRLTVPAMVQPRVIFDADFTYPKDVTTQPNSFAYRFMKLASSRIMNAKGTPPNDNLIGVRPFPGRAEAYPQMDQDPDKISPFKGSISHGDAIFDPIYAQDAGFEGVLDSLYVYQARTTGSSYNNKLNAVRWHDPDPAREHGRTQWFGFPLYFMKKDQAQETFNRAIDWFREEARP